MLAEAAGYATQPAVCADGSLSLIDGGCVFSDTNTTEYNVGKTITASEVASDAIISRHIKSREIDWASLRRARSLLARSGQEPFQSPRSRPTQSLLRWGLHCKCHNVSQFDVYTLLCLDFFEGNTCPARLVMERHLLQCGHRNVAQRAVPQMVSYTLSPAEAEFGVLTAGFGTIQLCL
jgi:hypothetical protein